MALTVDQVRAKARVGREVTLHLTGGTTLYGTVLDHGRGQMILGVHPDLLAIPYQRIVKVGR